MSNENNDVSCIDQQDLSYKLLFDMLEHIVEVYNDKEFFCMIQDHSPKLANLLEDLVFS